MMNLFWGCITSFLVLAFSANAQTITNSTSTTSIDVSEANLLQLLGAINYFHDKEVEMNGLLFSTAADDTYWFHINDNLNLMVSLDDGRSVSAKAKKCDDEIHAIMAGINNKPIEIGKGCKVTMTVQMDVDINVNYIILKGTGYNVVFSD